MGTVIVTLLSAIVSLPLLQKSDRFLQFIEQRILSSSQLGSGVPGPSVQSVDLLGDPAVILIRFPDQFLQASCIFLLSRFLRIQDPVQMGSEKTQE